MCRYQVWSHHKKLRMTREEIKEEHKENEGDPQIKARIREQQQAHGAQPHDGGGTRGRRGGHQSRRTTRWRWRYRRRAMGAPRVVAKGADLVAARIREIWPPSTGFRGWRRRRWRVRCIATPSWTTRSRPRCIPQSPKCWPGSTSCGRARREGGADARHAARYRRAARTGGTPRETTRRHEHAYCLARPHRSRSRPVTTRCSPARC